MTLKVLKSGKVQMDAMTARQFRVLIDDHDLLQDKIDEWHPTRVGGGGHARARTDINAVVCSGDLRTILESIEVEIV